MTIMDQVLIGIVIALISSILTKIFCSKSVENSTCTERRSACTALLIEKIDAIHHRLDQLVNYGTISGREIERLKDKNNL